MRTLQVDLGERSYPIIIGSHLLGQGDLLRPYIAGRQVAIVTNSTVAPLYLERLQQALGGYAVISIVLPMVRLLRIGSTCSGSSMACCRRAMIDARP